MHSGALNPEVNPFLLTKYSKSHFQGRQGGKLNTLKMSDWDWQSLPSANTTVYRFGNSSFRFQTKFVLLVVILFVLCLIYAAMPSLSNNELSINSLRSSDVSGKRASLLWGSMSNSNNLNSDGSSFSPNHDLVSPNAIKSLIGVSSSTTMKYPLTSPVQTEKGLKYRIGIISDLDTDSKTPSQSKWISYLRRGSLYLQFNKLEPYKSQVSVEWEGSEPHVVKSGLNQDGRGMELSELFVFNGKLYSCDDRTGIIYHLQEGENEEVEPVPWVILADGNGTMAKGFKCEWACVKHGYLWVGGLGKEWTTNTGEVINHSPQYVKHISAAGEVVHMDWRGRYNKLSHAMNIYFPGYVIHESAGWSDILKKWMFLPRRASTEQYDDKTDEKKGTNVMLFVDESFENVEVKYVGDVNPTHGFSSFKWIPGTDDQLVVALKSEEIEGKTATYLMVFDIKGNILIPETKVGEHKYEGVEFL